MGRTKGSNLVTLRRMLEEHDGKSYLPQFLEALSPEDRSRFESTLQTDWVSIEYQNHMNEIASKILWPNQPNAREKLGYRSACVQLSGIYRAFLAVASIPFIIKRASKMWQIHHEEGVADIRTLNDRVVEFSVSDYPSLPAGTRADTSGWIHALTERAGGKNVSVKHDSTNPRRWVWIIKWA